MKMGYKLLCDEDGLDSASNSNSESVVRFWRSLWKLNIAGKIKHFLWTACIDVLLKKQTCLSGKLFPIHNVLSALRNPSLLNMLFGPMKLLR